MLLVSYDLVTETGYYEFQDTDVTCHYDSYNLVTEIRYGGLIDVTCQL